MFSRENIRESRAKTVQVFSSRLSVVIFMAIALVLMLLDRAEANVFEKARDKITDVTTPIYEFLKPPVDAVREFFSDAGRILYVYEENKRLREENARLMAWKAAALQLERQNSRYEALLNVKTDPDVEYVSGRVVTDTGGPFIRTLIVNVGQRDGVAAGHAVIDANGLVGRVISSGRHSSRVLMLSDFNSRVPVLVTPSNYRGILVGDNKAKPRLDFLPKEAVVSVGDLVVTSGHAGVLPPGLPIGVISEMEDGSIRVRQHSHLQRVDRVRILKYEFPRDADKGVSDQTAQEQVTTEGAQ